MIGGEGPVDELPWDVSQELGWAEFRWYVDVLCRREELVEVRVRADDGASESLAVRGLLRDRGFATSDFEGCRGKRLALEHEFGGEVIGHLRLDEDSFSCGHLSTQDADTWFALGAKFGPTWIVFTDTNLW